MTTGKQVEAPDYSGREEGDGALAFCWLHVLSALAFRAPQAARGDLPSRSVRACALPSNCFSNAHYISGIGNW